MSNINKVLLSSSQQSANPNLWNGMLASTQNIATFSTSMGSVRSGPCKGCGHHNILDDRGLCLAKCHDIIPVYIPEQQYKRYRDRIVLGKIT